MGHIFGIQILVCRMLLLFIWRVIQITACLDWSFPPFWKKCFRKVQFAVSLSFFRSRCSIHSVLYSNSSISSFLYTASLMGDGQTGGTHSQSYHQNCVYSYDVYACVCQKNQRVYVFFSNFDCCVCCFLSFFLRCVCFCFVLFVFF